MCNGFCAKNGKHCTSTYEIGTNLLYDNPDPSDPGSGIWDPDLESIRVVNTLNFEQQQQATLTSDLIYDFTFKEE